MTFKVVIPARYASTRLPGKPLLEIAGKPMIEHVYRRAEQSGAAEIVVATDDERIATAVKGFSGDVCMTSTAHRSGTDRIAEVARQRDWAEETIIVNLQGDEPTMPASLVHQVAQDMALHPQAAVTTLSTPIHFSDDLFDPHIVKVVTDAQGFALYFSRAAIPWHRDEFLKSERTLPENGDFQRHIGLYAYHAGFLQDYVIWPPATIERAESLEQLRVLWHGQKIHVSVAEEVPGHGVDTLSDLKRVEKQLMG